jgi:hypothetical protein
MSFACHLDEGSGFFSASSYFNPVEPEICPLDDPTPEFVKIERKKNNGITYLPGEKLLLQLSKQRKKQKKTQSNLDVERVTASLGRILSL